MNLEWGGPIWIARDEEGVERGRIVKGVARDYQAVIWYGLPEVRVLDDTNKYQSFELISQAKSWVKERLSAAE